MIRFDRLIRAGMVVREVKQQYPSTVAVFESHGFRPACDDCDIETGARKNGVAVAGLLEALNRAAFGAETGG